MVISGICFMGTGLVLMNFITSPLTFYIAWGVLIGTAHGFGFAIAIDKMLTDWFISKRGLAIGLRFALMGIVGAIILPLISWLITAQGWRITCLIWAGVIFACIPFALYFVRQRRPEYYGLLPDGARLEASTDADREGMIARGVEYAAGFQETEFTLREAMRTPSYWILTVALILFRAVIGGFYIHCIPFLTDMGIDPVVAGSMMAMMVFFTIPSRFLGGAIVDRVSKEHLKFLMAGAFVSMGIGIAAFLLIQTTATVYILLILFGLGSGSFIPLDIVIRGRYFGRNAYGSIQGTSTIFAAPITFFAPVFTGWVYDVTGSYMNAFVIFAVIATFTAFILCLMRAPKLPDHTGDIRF